MNFDIKLTSITIKKPSAPPGSVKPGGAEADDTRVTYYRGDPEFDALSTPMTSRSGRLQTKEGCPKILWVRGLWGHLSLAWT